MLVTVNDSPPALFAGNDQQVCQGNLTALNATGALSYNWSNGLTNGFPFIPGNSQTYYVLGVALNGCTSIDSVVIAVVPLPSVFAGNDITICEGQSVVLAGSGAITYNWTSNIINNQPFFPTVSNSYLVTGFDVNGCSSSDQILINVMASPISNAGADFVKTCISNASGSIIGSSNIAGTTYSWSPNIGLSSATISNPIANPSVTTTYTLTATNTSNGCAATDNVIVNLDISAPIANAGLDFTKTCNTNTAGLTIGSTNTAGTTYNWSPTIGLNSATISNPIANPSVTSTYTLIATNTTNGCIATDNVLITVSATPTNFDLGSNRQICVGDSIQIFAPNLNLTVTWYGLAQGLVGDTINLIGAASGNVICELVNSDGCAAIDSISIQVNSIPYPIISGNLNVCANSYWESYQVNPTSNYLTWNITNGEIIAGHGSEKVYVHWFNGTNGLINVREQLATTGCFNNSNLNITFGDTALQPANVSLLYPNGNILFTDLDYSIMNWGYESVSTHIPVYLGIHTQYCQIPTFDPSNYNYWVEIGDGSGCLTKSYYNFPTFPIGVNENNFKSKFILFPNPARNEINLLIENYDKDEFIYTIEDLLGAKIMNGRLVDGVNKIDVSFLSSNLYFIRVQSKNNTNTIKFIKE